MQRFIKSKLGKLYFCKRWGINWWLLFLDNWTVRSETSNALSKLFVKNKNIDIEEELIFSDEQIIVPNVSSIQKDKNTDLVYFVIRL